MIGRPTAQPNCHCYRGTPPAPTPTGVAVSSSCVWPLVAKSSDEKITVGLPIGTITFELHLVCRINGGFEETATLLISANTLRGRLPSISFAAVQSMFTPTSTKVSPA